MLKWSLDRAVTVGSFPILEMTAGSRNKPAQFVVLDGIIRIDFLRKDRLTLPDLAVPAIFNSKVAQCHATNEGPLGAGLGEDQRRRRLRL